MNHTIVGHGAVRNGTVQLGAVALLLGAALASTSAHAAEENDAETRKEEARIETRLREAQERLEEAAAEVAELASQRAVGAMENFTWLDNDSRRAVIGVQLATDGSEGAPVLDVSPGGPAEQAGLRAGDVIVSVDGKDVKKGKSAEVAQLLKQVKPETAVKLQVMREGKPVDFVVVARPMRASAYAFHFDPPPGLEHMAVPSPPVPPLPFISRFGLREDLKGLEVTTLTPQLGRYFGTEKGVLVVRAPTSDLLKLQDGDVIVAIDGREPTSSSHVTRILSSYQPGEKLTLRVMRDRKARDIVVTLPENEGGRRVRTTRLRDPL